MTELVPTHKQDSAKLRCVLVHGTNACDAFWTKETSPFAKELLKLEPDGVALYRFRWSGANSHNERVEATTVLREALAQEAIKYPEACFLLVGHSHGGNIVCRAADTLPRNQLIGVVCMATPFFHVQARKLYPVRWAFAGLAMFKMLLFMLTGAGFPWLIYWLNPSFFELRMKGFLWLSHGGLVGQVILTLCFLYPSTLYFLAAFSTGFKAENTTNIVSRIQSLENWDRIRPTAVHTLCLWHVPDEPYWALKILRYSGEYVHFLIEMIAKFGFPLLLAASFFAAAWLGFTMVPTDSGYSLWNTLFFRMVLAFGLAGTAMFVVPTLLWSIGVLTSTLARHTYGKVSASEFLWLDINLKRFPNIASHLIEKGPLKLGTGSFYDNIAAVIPISIGQLVHSKVYADASTAPAIQIWYKKRVRELEQCSI